MTYIKKESLYDLLTDFEAVYPEATAAFRVAVADMKAENEALRGVIVCGYQGIGKSTLASKSSYVVDLESSAFLWTESGRKGGMKCTARRRLILRGRAGLCFCRVMRRFENIFEKTSPLVWALWFVILRQNCAKNG